MIDNVSCNNSNNNDYVILMEELDKVIEKWRQRLNHSNGEAKKDIHDCYLCSTIMYEIERAKQLAQNRIIELRSNAFKEKMMRDQSITMYSSTTTITDVKK